jgi:hypothetical protein
VTSKEEIESLQNGENDFGKSGLHLWTLLWTKKGMGFQQLIELHRNWSSIAIGRCCFGASEAAEPASARLSEVHLEVDLVADNQL